MQSGTATSRHGVTRKEAQKGLQDTEKDKEAWLFYVFNNGIIISYHCFES